MILGTRFMIQMTNLKLTGSWEDFRVHLDTLRVVSHRNNILYLSSSFFLYQKLTEGNELFLGLRYLETILSFSPSKAVAFDSSYRASEGKNSACTLSACFPFVISACHRAMNKIFLKTQAPDPQSEKDLYSPAIENSLCPFLLP